MSSVSGAAAVERHGRHYTPRELAGFVADRVARFLPDRPDIGVLDPACGDGELLLAVHRAVLQRAPRARLTLVGYDLDPQALRAARARAAALGLDVRWHEGDFLRVARELPASFDAVVTNPPYVRTQVLGHETARTLAAEFGLTGRIDLTHPFVTVVPSVLRPGGVLGLLCSNRFLTTRAGANVRRVLCGPLRPPPSTSTRPSPGRRRTWRRTANSSGRVGTSLGAGGGGSRSGCLSDRRCGRSRRSCSRTSA